jgi:hypothetical protein
MIKVELSEFKAEGFEGFEGFERFKPMQHNKLINAAVTLLLRPCEGMYLELFTLEISKASVRTS